VPLASGRNDDRAGIASATAGDVDKNTM